MRNDDIRSKRILKLTAALPLFGAADLAPIGEKREYLNIILSRQVKQGMMLHLRRNLYVTKSYLDNAERRGIFSSYVEFAANKLYPPSYLSLDYVLHEHNMLTEIPRNITSVGLRKTDRFSNDLGNFIYHKIKEELYLGFKVVKKGDFAILKATKAKALFDFLYLRKRLLVDKRAVEELRLNLDEFTENDFKELQGYVETERSPRMKEISNWLK
jgi:predicted transcriptional regulator of viral defense system